jgi:hypothetical protein
MRDVATECGDGFSGGIKGAWVDDSGNSVRSECPVTADIDFDGQVGIGDLLTMLSQWGPQLHNMSDIHRAPEEIGSRVDATDLVRLINAWGDVSQANVDIIPTDDGWPFEDF